MCAHIPITKAESKPTKLPSGGKHVEVRLPVLPRRCRTPGSGLRQLGLYGSVIRRRGGLRAAAPSQSRFPDSAETTMVGQAATRKAADPTIATIDIWRLPSMRTLSHLVLTVPLVRPLSSRAAADRVPASRCGRRRRRSPRPASSRCCSARASRWSGWNELATRRRRPEVAPLVVGSWNQERAARVFELVAVPTDFGLFGGIYSGVVGGRGEDRQVVDLSDLRGGDGSGVIDTRSSLFKRPASASAESCPSITLPRPPVETAFQAPLAKTLKLKVRDDLAAVSSNGLTYSASVLTVPATLLSTRSRAISGPPALWKE
jgi:hypothetical protein